MSGWVQSIVFPLLAGLLTVLSPCLFPILPMYVVYVARATRSPLKATLVFASALSFSLAAYAAAVVSIGRALLPLIGSTEDASFVLATLLLVLAVAEVTPARYLFSAAAARPVAVRRLSLAGAAALGALFAILAAPCAAAPLLAWTAQLMLQPSAAVPSLLAFLAGVTAPFLAIGALAHSVGPRLHRSISRSIVIRRSYELTALLLALFAAVTLLSLGNPVAEISKRVARASPLIQALLSLGFVVIGALTVVDRSVLGRALALLALLTGVIGVVVALPGALPWGLLATYSSLALVFAALCYIVSVAQLVARAGGGAGLWIAIYALTAGLVASLQPFLRTSVEISVGYYLISTISAGMMPASVAAVVQGRGAQGARFH